jgi:prepilin-type N-terminal cleavage/methylation domain-containing protein
MNRADRRRRVPRGVSRVEGRARRGFTLIETLIAISLLAGVVLTMAMSTTISSRNVQASGSRSRAQAIVDQQIARARSWPTYATLTDLAGASFNGSANGLTTATTVTSDTTSGKSVTAVSVTVIGATTTILATPIVRSISIAAP